jgi:hypothetical protein
MRLICSHFFVSKNRVIIIIIIITTTITTTTTITVQDRDQWLSLISMVVNLSVP